MTFKLHIANTFFEWELETQPTTSLKEAFWQHAIFRQLQFLPIFYFQNEEAILLADPFPTGYAKRLQLKGMSIPRCFLLDDHVFSPYTQLESWGPSQLIAEWANRKSLIYRMPNWNLVKEMNSKYFSFTNSPRLPNASLLENEAQAKQWLRSFEGEKVLKTCYGVSGKGHLIIENETVQQDRIFSFLKKEWDKNLPVIGEPWVKRILDFSTQWIIEEDKRVIYVGATLCKNDKRGQYQYNLVGNEQELFSNRFSFLVEHQTIVKPLIQWIADKGFFGNLGIDAMVYILPENSEILRLHPIVEINARKTMGWAALKFQRHYFPNKFMRFSYTSKPAGLLPESVETKQRKKIRFSRNLEAEIFSECYLQQYHVQAKS